MSFRTKVLGLVDVMMRVPPILVIDEILKIDMGLPARFYPASSDDASVDNSASSAGGALNDIVAAAAALTNSTITTQSSTNVPGMSAAGEDASTVSPIELLLQNTSAVAATIINATKVASASSAEQVIGNSTTAITQGGVLTSSFGYLVDELASDSEFADILSITSIRFVFCLFGFLSAACIFLLWTRHLVMVYMFVISLGLTFLSYWSNVSALGLMEDCPCLLEDILSLNMTRLLDTSGVAISLIPHLVAQWFMGMLFAYIHLGPRYAIIQKSMPLIFASPILLAMLPLPPAIIKHIPVFADVIPLILTKITLMSSAMEAGKTVYNGYQYSMNFVSNFGLSALIENEWQRLNVPSVLRVFWTIRIGQELISMLIANSVTPLNFLPTMQKLLVNGCGTLTAVLGMTSVISIICHYIGKMFQWYLISCDNDEEKSLGTVSAVLFYILALQTGLTSLSPDKRFIRLCRNLCLLVTALLHFLHNIVSPILMSLSAARNPSRKRHTRALTVCVFLIMAPICLLTCLWSRHSPSTWLLAVTAFSVEVIVKVLVSLATYTLFLLDARRQTFWEKLDDYVYYVRAFGNSVEFCFGILLFFNGAWILIFESGGAIRAIMMCIHAYFNIWCEARAGWSVFMKRRSAVHKISGLPEATPTQLSTFDDVCAICYQEMASAKITRCRHFFHGVCLRKWLYVQDRCPLCHEIMMYTDKADELANTRHGDVPAVANDHPGNIENSPEVVHRLSSELVASPSTPTESPSLLASTSATVSTTSATSAATSAVASVAATAAGNAANSFRLLPDLDVQE